MNLTQQRIDGLIEQLAMAQAKSPPSAIQIAVLKAQIDDLTRPQSPAQMMVDMIPQVYDSKRVMRITKMDDDEC